MRARSSAFLTIKIGRAVIVERMRMRNVDVSSFDRAQPGFLEAPLIESESQTWDRHERSVAEPSKALKRVRLQVTVCWCALAGAARRANHGPVHVSHTYGSSSTSVPELMPVMHRRRVC